MSLIAITRGVSRSLEDCELTWMDRDPIDIDKAIAQHQAYEDCLRELGARVIALPALEANPDAVFVEDPALVLDEVAVLTTMGCESRRGERETLAAALTEFRPVLRMRDPARLEGGDVMRIGKQLFVGLSARTDAEGVAELQSLVAPYGYCVIAVKLRDCLHLKSACSYLGDDIILIDRDLLDTTALRGYRFIDVPPEEPGAANALCVNDTIVLASAFPATAELLRAGGFAVRTVDVTELLKAESGVTCSSLIFDATRVPPIPNQPA
jgi:dimethylargininase